VHVEDSEAVKQLRQERRLPGNLVGLTLAAIALSMAAFLLMVLGGLLGGLGLQFPR
jgi:hypothetical protein